MRERLNEINLEGERLELDGTAYAHEYEYEEHRTRQQADSAVILLWCVFGAFVVACVWMAVRVFGAWA